MSKERRTISLTPENDAYLGKEGVNASQLVDRLVESYRSAGGDETGMLKLREQQLQSEISELESRLEAKRSELEQVQDQLAEFQADQDSIIADAADALPQHVRHEDNPAVENWAEKAGLSPSELLDRLADHDDEVNE